MIAREAPELIDALSGAGGFPAGGWKHLCSIAAADCGREAPLVGATKSDGSVDYQRLADVAAMKLGFAWRALWGRTREGTLYLAPVAGDA